MKRWLRADEWTQYALCGDSDDRYITPPGGRELACPHCPVRPECIGWALDDDVSGVIVAGMWIPEAPDGVLDPWCPDWDDAPRLEALDILRGMLDDEVMVRGDI